MTKDSIPIFDFRREPDHTIEFTAKEIMGAYIASLQGDRTGITEIEKGFYEAPFFNTVVFNGRKIVSKVSRDSELCTGLLHQIISILVRNPATRIVFMAYNDGPIFPCDQKPETRKEQI